MHRHTLPPSSTSTNRGAAGPGPAWRCGTTRTTTPLLESWSSFRRRLLRARVSSDQSNPAKKPDGPPAWQVADWTPVQPAIVFGQGGAEVAAAAAASAPPTSPAAAADADPTILRLAVYTKPGCPLCDNLADRAQALLDRAAFLPGGGLLAQAGVDVSRRVERRDVSGDASWAAAHAGEVPVLVLLRRKRRGGGGEEQEEEEEEEEEIRVPRPPPRVTADKLERHLAAAAAVAAEAAAAAAEAPR
jgi:hypothetical protein